MTRPAPAVPLLAGVLLAGVLVAGVLVAGCAGPGSGSGQPRPTGATASPARPTAAAARTVAPPAADAGPVDGAVGVVTMPAPPRSPAPTPCAGNRWAKWVYVDLGRQHMWMCEKRRVARDTAVTTGMRGAATETPTGVYRIQGLNRDTVLTLADGRTYPVKYWIPFDAPLFGFHDSPWQHFPYGSARYRTAGSHGCVHMPLAAIRFLYRWAGIGTRVTIRP
jgi:hypothetical protein